MPKKNRLNNLSGKEWVKGTKSWFTIDVSKKDYPTDVKESSWLVVDGRKKDISEEVEGHPATFPPELIEKFIRFFTKECQNVLDPFLGTGNTLRACYNTKRNCYGIELNDKYFEYAKKRGEEILSQSRLTDEDIELSVIHDDAMNIDEISIPEIDFVITSPPYWNMLHKSRGNIKSTQKRRKEKGLDTIYGDDVRDFGNIESYPIYLDKIESLFKKIHGKLKKGGHIVIIVQNIRDDNGDMIPVAWDIGKALSKQYRLMQEYIWCQDQKFLGCWGYPSEYVSNVHHHYCLVFQKRK